ncbi:MAG: 2-C-methyl-D-erythritol 4-phosphate cytidylyltransferase [Planctomycetes bacterium]|nr:2-C-methyl-D-erythritol 4-phosphate cytidylyltransferase [Planctomycetota bacterium]
MCVSVILLAAGAGRRMKRRTPKALLPLAGRPLYLHSLEVFRRMPEVAQIVLVTPPKTPFAGGVPGGRRRQDSVLQGLRATDPRSDFVLIHDAARPFVTVALARRVLRAARRHGAAVPAIPPRDTLKRVGPDGRVEETHDRSNVRCVQTPQGFRRDLLLEAYGRGCAERDATDDAQIVERAGKTVVAVDGDSRNFKITSSSDLEYAEYLLQKRRRSRVLPAHGRKSGRGASR